MKDYYSIAELLVLKIANLPETRRGLDKLIGREHWDFVEVPSRGAGGMRREYRLPAELARTVQLSLLKQASDDAPAPIVVVAPFATSVAISTTQLADWQRQCAEARLVLVREVEQRVRAGVKKTKALESVVAEASAGVLPESVQGLVALANARSGADRAISRRSLFEWVGAVATAESSGVSAIAVLAPKPRVQKIPDWAGALLKVWGQPQKPNLTAVLEMLPELLPTGVDCPSYSQAYRFLTESVGAVEREKGRMGSRQLKNIQPFVRRDTTLLLPTDAYTADGHCFDAEVAHPIHGRPFRPEITTVIDIATRLVVGFSVDLAESGWAVLDAIRLSATNWGIPALFYVDNGSGYQNDMMKAQGRGVMARLGTEMTHSLPYNSQARGIIERSHQTLWVKAAKNLPTYMGADMDDQARQKAFKVTRRDIKAVGTSKLLVQWDVFLDYAKQVVSEYNHKPHSSLPKFLDRSTMKKRHQSPIECWHSAVSAGAEIHKVDDAEAVDLFRPYVERVVRRGEVELFGNKYFSIELEQYHGESMQIGYDIHDPEQVWVRDAEGRLVATAQWNANRTSYFPQSKIEQARQQRAKGRLRNLAVKQAEALEEAGPARVLEHLDTQQLPVFSQQKNDLASVFAELNSLEPHSNVVPFHQGRKAEPLHVDQPSTTRSPAEKLAHWLVLDEQANAGIELSMADFDFWTMFPQGKLFRSLTDDQPELRRRGEAASNQ
jgi:putative transposase